VLACILISIGYTFNEAVEKIQGTRRQVTAWETDDRYQAIREYAKRIGKSLKSQHR